MEYMNWLLIVSLVCYSIGSAWRIPLAAGILAQAAYMVMRALMVGRLPLLGPHDTLVFFSLCIGASALAMTFSPSLRNVRWFRISGGVTAAFFTLFALRFKPLFMPLPQILDTAWFELHVILAFLAYALFVLGGVLASAFLRSKKRPYLDLQYKTALTGWTFFSASMISGGIWGYYAWGTYWLWTAKELWTSVLWLFYAMLLHLRYKGSAWDSFAAWLAIAGVAVMLFTYLGVSMLMKSSHSF